MTSAVLSPHLDDAVLSCWHLLEGPGDVVVVNACTASPPPGGPIPPWDRLTGATDTVARMRERRAEDARVMDRLGRRAVSLDLLDHQYGRDPVDPSMLARRLDALLDPGATVHAPAGLGGHPDHELVRSAALELALAGRPLRLYADLPHGIAVGWPAWVSAVSEARGVDVGAGWDATLAAAGLVVARLVPRIRALDARARDRKLQALAEYRSQRAALDDLSFVPLADPRALAFEVAWDVPASALGGLREARGEPLVADAPGDCAHERR